MAIDEGYAGTNFSAAELMQYRNPVGGGPSLNTWPWWPSHRAQWTSVRGTNSLKSVLVPMTWGAIGCQKLGQPVPLSNLCSDENNGRSQPAHRYTPGSLLS